MQPRWACGSLILRSRGAEAKLRIAIARCFDRPGGGAGGAMGSRVCPLEARVAGGLERLWQ